MWKNKHIVVAMLVAPVLAIMAWFAVDKMVGEQPAAAREGGAYSLVAKPNCRYASGKCELANGNFLLTLVRQPDQRQLVLQSSHTLSAAVAAIGSEQAGFGSERSFSPSSDSVNDWQFTAGQRLPSDASLRLAVSASGSTYYATVPLTFLGNVELDN
ncbi:MAG: hypothetical protein AAF270_14005 [Pseudomonadota bacterium]